MPDILEVQAVEQFIDAALLGSTALNALISQRIYNTERPQAEGAYPLVVYAQHDGNEDREAIGNNARILTKGSWMLKAITKGDDFGEAMAVMKAADDAIRGKRGRVENIRIMGNRRTAVQKYTESINGVRFNHVFAIYTFWAHERH